jgi:linalool 8-monooxygenase
MSRSPASDLATVDLADPDLYVPGVPWDLFARLRREDPVHWNEGPSGTFWALTRHADIVEVSRQPELFSSARENGGHRIFDEHVVGLTSAGEADIGVPFISRDPPSHTAYRRMVMPALTPARMGDIEARVTERCRALISTLPLEEPLDFVQALAAPLPLLTLAELLDVPPETWTKLYTWTNAFVGEDDPEFRRSPEDMQAILGAFFAFSQDLFEERRTRPGSDLASLLANAEVDGDPISFGEFIANLILVLVGGNETTRNSLSHSIAQFSAQPEAWTAVRSDPEILAAGVKELVRWASPVMHMRRTATADTEIAGRRISKGDRVVLWYIAGNRDEAAFEDPDRFDIHRRNVAHLGFGTGQHVCVGWRLAELQLKIAFRLLAERVSRIEPLEPPRRLRSNFINGLKSLNLRLYGNARGTS